MYPGNNHWEQSAVKALQVLAGLDSNGVVFLQSPQEFVSNFAKYAANVCPVIGLSKNGANAPDRQPELIKPFSDGTCWWLWASNPWIGGPNQAYNSQYFKTEIERLAPEVKKLNWENVTWLAPMGAAQPEALETVQQYCPPNSNWHCTSIGELIALYGTELE